MRAESVPVVVLALGAVLCGGLSAQDERPVVAVGMAGERAQTATLRGRGVGALETLSAIARESGYELALTDDDGAELGNELDARPLDLDLADRSFEETLFLIGSALDLHVRVDAAARRILVSRPPEAGRPEAVAFFRERAVAATRDAYIADSSDSELLLRAARLEIAGGDLEAAWKSFGRFLETPRIERHPAAPRACLDAARCALALGRTDDAWRTVDRFFRSFPGHPDLAKAEIIAAEARILEGAWADAIRLLRSIERSSREGKVDERDGLIAELLLAEVLWRIGQFDQALDVLESVRLLRGKAQKDLLDAVPLYVGHCRRAKADLAAAVIAFRTAAHLAPTDDVRMRAMVAQTETLIEMGSPGEALMAARVAMKLQPEGEDRAAVLRLSARARQRLGLLGPALADLEHLLSVIDELIPDPRRRRTETASIFVDVADLYMAMGRGIEAIAWFDRAATDPRLRENAVVMAARCELAGGRAREALERLDALLEERPETPLAAEIARLRGDAFMALDLYELAVEAYGGPR